MNPEWEVSPQEVQQAVSGGVAGGSDVLLIDVRRPDEHAIARIAGAVLIPLDTIASRADELQDLAAGKQVITHCHHGMRSLKAAGLLRAIGINAKSMAGGIDLWSQQIDPSVPRY